MLRKKKYIIILIVLIASILFFYIQNNSIETTEITIRSEKIPVGFDNYRIVHLTDLHGKNFGNNQQTLVKKINNAKPDLIVFTGDLIDSRRYNEKHSLTLMEELVQIAPTFFVTGNHEGRSRKFQSLESELNLLGVEVMRNSTEIVESGNDIIYLIGIDDPTLIRSSSSEQDKTIEAIERSIVEMEDGYFNILLSHRPEMLPLYSEYGFDVVFSGHAHGGQIRLPVVGGLIAPNQGLFPKYTSGKYKNKKTTMIVNRGLGNSLFPLRVFNRPEIIVVTLYSE
ncbi:metallophosphoesterase [Evansella sp. AB-P1]|uniref:metallophosphoesterase n=1 Tax=Evansella sp. AB-P1 TaxID=3037653 RepID=UPI00241F0FD1|nr:metallophosphoesterase [Evansella sp. AB-P1]MDG5788570.1 metallophosphoesterase [Evansella sp. AB-P1]